MIEIHRYYTTTVRLGSRQANQLTTEFAKVCPSTSILMKIKDTDRWINGRSLLGILSLGCEKNTEIEVKISAKTNEEADVAFSCLSSWFADNAESAS